MIEDFLLPKTLVQRIAKATHAILIVQWAYEDTLHKSWNATDPDNCGTSQAKQYWIIVVVNDDDPRSPIELMQAGRNACKGHGYVSIRLLRKKEALRRLKNNQGDFSVIYRLGHPVYNTDKKGFPEPGYAAGKKKQLPQRPVRNNW